MVDYQNIFNRDFYTTPREVFDMMTQGESLVDAVVLEPSAGSGNIVRFCKEDGARYVKACEINDTLRNSLYNECNVIAHFNSIKVRLELLSTLPADCVVTNFNSIKVRLERP